MRRGCGACVVVAGVLETGAQPSVLPVVVAVVGVVGVASVADGVTCAGAAPGSDGIAGIVPIESSYTGRFASLGCAGRGAGCVV
jgi:hypothetical protein